MTNYADEEIAMMKGRLVEVAKRTRAKILRTIKSYQKFENEAFCYAPELIDIELFDELDEALDMLSVAEENLLDRIKHAFSDE